MARRAEKEDPFLCGTVEAGLTVDLHQPIPLLAEDANPTEGPSSRLHCIDEEHLTEVVGNPSKKPKQVSWQDPLVAGLFFNPATPVTCLVDKAQVHEGKAHKDFDGDVNISGIPNGGAPMRFYPLGYEKHKDQTENKKHVHEGKARIDFDGNVNISGIQIRSAPVRFNPYGHKKDNDQRLHKNHGTPPLIQVFNQFGDSILKSQASLKHDAPPLVQVFNQFGDSILKSQASLKHAAGQAAYSGELFSRTRHVQRS